MTGRESIANQRAPVSSRVSFYWDDDYPVFENSRGLMVNGNRRIHMKNWKVEDLKAIVGFLDRYANHVKEAADDWEGSE